jgi:DNA polymerase III alpha subunit (gram-positive type)
MSINIANLLPKNFIVAHIETTGLAPEYGDEIIEIGALKINHRDFAHQQAEVIGLTSLINPTEPLKSETVHITGISRDLMAREGVPRKAAMLEFKQFIGTLPVIVFNAEFHENFFRHEFELHGLALTNEFDCALELARDVWPNEASYRLLDLTAAFTPAPSLKRAIAKAQRTLVLYRAAMEYAG